MSVGADEATFCWLFQEKSVGSYYNGSAIIILMVKLELPDFRSYFIFGDGWKALNILDWYV